MGTAPQEIDDLLADIAEHYPGSKKRRRSPEESKPKVSVSAWDSEPIVRTVRGEKREFFLANALASALGRSSVTVRTWESKGYLPKAPYRLPGYTDARGVQHPGRRVYTRQHIEIAVEEFRTRGLLGSVRVNWKTNEDLTIAIFERWQKIQATTKSD